MKKIILILVLIFSLLLFGCKKEDNNKDNNKGNDDPVEEKANVNYSIADFTLESDEGKDWICFNVIVNSDKDVNVKFDLDYTFNDNILAISSYLLPMSTLANVDTNVQKGTSLLDFRVELTEDNYKNYLCLVINNKSEDYNCIDVSDDSIEKSVLSIALDVLSKDANNEIAQKIDNTVNAIIVATIDLSIDYENKKVQALGAGYTVESNFTDDYIIVEIIFSPKAKLTEDFTLFVVKNGKEVAKGFLYIENNKYYYKEELEKTNTDVIISSITLTFDYLKHSEEIKRVEYTAVMSNPEYNKITITITMNEGYVLSDSLVLTLNDKIIDNSKYKIENNVLTYVFDDPNWTGFY